MLGLCLNLQALIFTKKGKNKRLFFQTRITKSESDSGRLTMSLSLWISSSFVLCFFLFFFFRSLHVSLAGFSLLLFYSFIFHPNRSTQVFSFFLIQPFFLSLFWLQHLSSRSSTWIFFFLLCLPSSFFFSLLSLMPNPCHFAEILLFLFFLRFLAVCSICLSSLAGFPSIEDSQPKIWSLAV